MLDLLGLVLGAVSQKEMVPLEHTFYFKDGRVQGGNGKIAISAPLLMPELDGRCVPAEKFYKAVQACDGEPTIKLLDAGFLQVSKKRSKIKLPCPAGDAYACVPPPPANVDGELEIAPLRLIQPFISQDASKPFSVSVLLKNNFAYATNNAAIVRTPIKYTGPEVSIPVYCVEELLRLGTPRWTITFVENGLYLQAADVWLFTRCTLHPWPTVEAFFADTPDLPTVNKAVLLAALNKVVPFIEDLSKPFVSWDGDCLKTMSGSMTAEVGMDDEERQELKASHWRHDLLALVLAVATHMDFSAYPKPCRFKGIDIEGVAVGVNIA